MIVTLLVSAGAEWDADVFGALNAHPGIVVLRRCVDVDDLLAAASTGQAEVAVVGADLPGLDAQSVADLAAYGLRVVALAPDPVEARPSAERIGIRTVCAVDPAEAVVEALLSPPTEPPEAPTLPSSGHDAAPPPAADAMGPTGRVVAVWGPAGAPGRTTIATALAAELARRELTTVLVDADPYGGCVAQQLGVLDEVSGLLAAARLAAGHQLEERLGSVQRRLSDRLRVVTGLPRADRWSEVRPGTVDQLVAALRVGAQVVVDTGFCLEHDQAADLSSRPERNGTTLEALDAADEIVVVGAADPVGLARLARGLAEVVEAVPGCAPHVVVNRMRPTLGWRERDVTAMLTGFAPTSSVSFLPDDQPAVDRALVAGRSLVESGDSALSRAVSGLLDTLAGVPATPPARAGSSRRRLRR